MGIAERKTRHKENVRANILATADRIIKKEGCGALSVRKIADAIEYSVPVIYEHFENKESILYELLLETSERFRKLMKQAKKKHSDPEDRLKAYVYTYWNFSFKNKEYYQLMYGLGTPCCGAGKMKSEVKGFLNPIEEAIEKIMVSRHSDLAEISIKTYALWSVLHGLISIILMRNSDVDTVFNKKSQYNQK